MHLNAACPLEGPQWSKQIASNMQKRWNDILSGYRLYYASQGKEAQGIDAADTIDSIKSLFEAVRDTLVKFRNLKNDAPQRLVDILLEVLETAWTFRVDARPAGAQSYAGGSQHFEYNLLLRFAALKSNWMTCLEAIHVLITTGYIEQFRSRKYRWKTMYTTLHSMLGQAKPPYPGESREMLGVLYHRLIAIGGKCAVRKYCWVHANNTYSCRCVRIVRQRDIETEISIALSMGLETRYDGAGSVNVALDR